MKLSTLYQLLAVPLLVTVGSSACSTGGSRSRNIEEIDLDQTPCEQTDGWTGDGSNEVIVRTDATMCGYGAVGNGVCPTFVDTYGLEVSPCCSLLGYCGLGLAYCGESGTGGGEGLCEIDPSIAGACLTDGECCSEFGFCSVDSCAATGGGGGECSVDDDCLVQADCSDGTCCCSQYGYCGTGTDYCGVGDIVPEGTNKTVAPTTMAIRVTTAPTPFPTGVAIVETISPNALAPTNQLTPEPTESQNSDTAPPTSEQKYGDSWGGDAHLDTLHPTLNPTQVPTSNVEPFPSGWGGDDYEEIDREEDGDSSGGSGWGSSGDYSGHGSTTEDVTMFHSKSGKSSKSSKGSKGSSDGDYTTSSLMYANTAPPSAPKSVLSVWVAVLIVVLLK